MGQSEEFSNEKMAATQTPKDDPGNPTVNFHGEKRSNETHESTTDPDCAIGAQERRA